MHCLYRITRDNSESGTVSFEVAEETDAGEYVCIVGTQLSAITGPTVSSTPTTVTIIGKGGGMNALLLICFHAR